MTPKQERFYHEYFDAAGNQKKLFPGEELVTRDPEVEDAIEQYSNSYLKSNIKAVDEYMKAFDHYDKLVTDANNASRYAVGYHSRGTEKWTYLLKKCDAFEPELLKKKVAAFDALLPTVRKLFPDFEIDETYTKPDTSSHRCRTGISWFKTKVDGHVFMIFITRDKTDYWNKSQSVIIRDDGIVLPEFNKIFTSKDDRGAAWKKFTTESQKTTTEKESAKAMKEIQESSSLLNKIKEKAKEFAKSVKIVFSDMAKYRNDPAFTEKLLGKFKSEGSELNLTNEERLVAASIIAESSSTFGKPEEDVKYKLACMICDEKPLSQEAKNIAYAYLSNYLIAKKS